MFTLTPFIKNKTEWKSPRVGAVGKMGFQKKIMSTTKLLFLFLFTSSKVVKLADFGTARIVSQLKNSPQEQVQQQQQQRQRERGRERDDEELGWSIRFV